MRQIARRVVVSVLDRESREHLYEMDYLQEGIGLRAMAQRDPLVEYQREGFQLFNAMMEGIKEESVGFLFNLEVQVEAPAAEGAEAPAAAETESAEAPEAATGDGGAAAEPAGPGSPVHRPAAHTSCRTVHCHRPSTPSSRRAREDSRPARCTVTLTSATPSAGSQTCTDRTVARARRVAAPPSLATTSA